MEEWYVLPLCTLLIQDYENKVKSNLLSRIQSMGMEENIFRVFHLKKKQKQGSKKTKSNCRFAVVLVEMVMSDK